MKTKTVSRRWLISEDLEPDELIIEEGGEIVAPEGTFAALIVRGAGRQIAPGSYQGKIVLALAAK